jgi:hypothetical protein
VNEISDGFGLRKVNPTGEVGAARELAWLGETTSAGEAVFRDAAHEERITMARDFERVVARERATSVPEYRDDLIDGFAVEAAPDAEGGSFFGEGGLAT